MTKILIVLLIALAFEALGVVILKQGIEEIKMTEPRGGAAGGRNVLRWIGQGFTSPRVLLGVLFEAIFFAEFVGLFCVQILARFYIL